MSFTYLTKDTLAICTFQTDPTPKNLIPTRKGLTVGKRSKELPLLTRKDRNIEVQFTCKSPMVSMVSFFALAAGLVVFAAIIATGPIGWIIAGAVVASCFGAYHATQIKHKCTPGLESGDWMLYHKTVKFDQHEAVV